MSLSLYFLWVIRFIFQDSTLKADIEAYISKGLMIAIKEFGSNDWAIRNSALMLFSSIAKRTVGAEKSADQQSTKNNLTIIEFFTRAPELLDFFLQEVEQYIKENQGNLQKSLYPSLYPIALIMARLLPYDSTSYELQKSAVTAQDEAQDEDRIFHQEEQKLIIAKIERFLPLFVSAAHNKNYMGRLMCAKAVLPLVPQQEISQQIIKLLGMKVLTDTNILKSDYNYAHGLLLQIYYLIKSYYRNQGSNNSGEKVILFEKSFLLRFFRINLKKIFL